LLLINIIIILFLYLFIYIIFNPWWIRSCHYIILIISIISIYI